MASYGVIGLGVMGSSLILNIAEKTGSRVAGFDLSSEKCGAAENRAVTEGFAEGTVKAFTKLEEFVDFIDMPRKIILLVPAGPAVDACLKSLGPLLASGDVVVDGGNEWFENTERREKTMRDDFKVHYVGCGVSGGAEGARHGPALMVGGPPEAFGLLKSTFEKIAARAAEDNAPCVVYCGTGGAGNYVKMVHNGIEYGDMELIGEAYALLSSSGYDNLACSKLFESWNDDTLLQSFLVDITAKILKKDQGTLVDTVLDKAGSKGTGKWTVQEAANQGVPAPTVAAALDARYSSALFSVRAQAGPLLLQESTSIEPLETLASDLEAALVCSKICSYAQGVALIQAAQKEHPGWDVSIAEVLRCWRGGCIIRAKLLVDFAAAVAETPNLDNLILHPTIAKMITTRVRQWRRLVAYAIASGQVPVPALSASLAYYDALRSPRLKSAALIQAQRDCFGGHTYKRLDDPDGPSHTSDWLN